MFFFSSLSRIVVYIDIVCFLTVMIIFSLNVILPQAMDIRVEVFVNAVKGKIALDAKK